MFWFALVVSLIAVVWIKSGRNSDMFTVSIRPLTVRQVGWAAIILGVAAAGLWSVGLEQSVALLKRNECRVCPRCRYVLSGLDDEGTCPECGMRYTLAGLEAVWRRTYAGLRPRRRRG
jgi:uncharacterized paraquat-inducible protein A